MNAGSELLIMKYWLSNVKLSYVFSYGTSLLGSLNIAASRDLFRRINSTAINLGYIHPVLVVTNSI